MSFIEDTDFDYDNYAENIDINRLVDDLIPRLKSAGITVMRYNAYSTNSIYLKLDFGVCNSIRISDHRGKKHLKYRYNLIVGLECSYHTVDKYPRYYYTEEDISEMVDKIISDRDAKIEKYGMKNYIKYMEENKISHKSDKCGFWSQALLV